MGNLLYDSQAGFLLEILLALPLQCWENSGGLHLSRQYSLRVEVLCTYAPTFKSISCIQGRDSLGHD